MVTDTKFNIQFPISVNGTRHADIQISATDETRWTAILRRERRTILGLVKQTLRHLGQANHIFVYKADNPPETAEIERLVQAIRRYGDNTLLVVRADPNSFQPSVERADSNLLLGKVTRFASPEEVVQDTDTIAWEMLCQSALDMLPPLRSKAASLRRKPSVRSSEADPPIRRPPQTPDPEYNGSKLDQSAPEEAANHSQSSLEIEGSLDHVDYSGSVSGWAASKTVPGDRRRISVSVNGVKLLGNILCDQFREDLKSAGIGDGCHSFKSRLPPEFLHA